MKALVTLLVVSLCLSPAGGQSYGRTVLKKQNSSADDITVVVQIGSSSDELVAREVKSYLTRELRALPSTTVVSSNGDFHIFGLVQETKTQSGQKTGYNLAFVIARKTQLILKLRQVIPELELTSAQWTILVNESKVAPVYEYQELLLYTGPSDGLQSRCRKVLALYDADYFEPERQRRDQLRKFLEEITK